MSAAGFARRNSSGPTHASRRTPTAGDRAASLGPGPTSARRLPEPSSRVCRLALPLGWRRGAERARRERSWRLQLPAPRPAGPGTSRGAPGAAPPASQLYLPPAGATGPPPHPHARRAQRPGRASKGISPPHSSRCGRADAGPAALGALGGSGTGRARRPAPPHPFPTTATPGRRGPPPGRGPTSLPTPEAGARRDPGRGTVRGPCLHRRVPRLRPGPRVPPRPRRAAPAYLHAGQARLHRGVSHGGQDGHFLGRDGRAAAIRAGDEARGPRAARGRRGRPAKPESGVGGAGRSPRPPQPRRVPGRRRAQRRAAGRVSMHRAGEGCEPLLLGRSPAAWARARWPPGAGVGAHSRPSRERRASRACRARPAPARPGPRARARPRGPAGDPAPRFREGEEALGRPAP